MRTGTRSTSTFVYGDAAAQPGNQVIDVDRQLNALTVDVEDYFHVAAFAGSIARSDWPSLPARVERNVLRLLDIFDTHRVRATFFVLGWVSERFPGLIQEIEKRGHEIACHGLSHRMIYHQSPGEFRTETMRSKEILEQIIGARVEGYRAASYSITKDSLWALDIIAECGFSYDSSIVPARHDLYGLPGFPSLPHRLLTRSGAQLIEFPPSTVRLFGQDIPAAGGGYFRLYPYALTRRFLRTINDKHRPFIFYIHPWEIDVEQPRVAANALSRFRHYVNIDKCEGRLERLLRDFRFDTVQKVLSSLELPLHRVSAVER